MKSQLKVTLLVLGGILLAFLGVIGYFCSFLQTPAGSRFLISQIQNQLAKKSQIKLDFRSGYLYPFSHIHFDNLRIIHEEGPNKTELQVKTLDLQYQIALFSRTLTLEQIQIDHPTLWVHTSSQKPMSPKETESVTQPQFKSQKVNSSPFTPPVHIVLKQFTLNNFSLELDQKFSNAELKAHLKNADLKFSLDWLASKLAISGDFELNESSHVSLLTFEGDQKTDLRFSPYGSIKGSMAMQSQSSQWNYEIHPSQLIVGMRNFDVRVEDEDSSVHTEMSHFKLESHAELQAHTKVPFHFDSHSFQKVHVRNSLSSGAIRSKSTRDGKQVFHADSQEGHLNIELTDKISAQIGYLLNEITLGETTLKPAQFSLKSVSTLPLDLSELRLQGSTSLNQIPLTEFRLQSQLSQNPRFEGQASITLKPELARVLKPVSSLLEMGGLAGEMSVQGQTQGNQTKVQLNANVPRLALRSLGKPWALHLGTEIQWREEKSSQFDIKGGLQIQNENALQWEAHTQIQPHQTETQSVIEARTGSYLEGLLTRQQIHGYGHWNTKTQFNLSTQSPQKIQFKGTTTVTQEHGKSSSPASLVLREPISLQHQMNLENSQAKLSFSGHVPRLEIPNTANLAETQITGQVDSPDYNSGREFHFDFDMNQGGINVAKALGNIPPLGGLKTRVRASIEEGRRFKMSEFTLDLNHSMLKLTAEAKGDSKAKNFQTEGSLVVDVPKTFPAISGQSLSGRVEFPWTLAIYRGKDLSFDGKVSLQDLSWSMAGSPSLPSVRIQGISGTVPVSEQLKVEGARIQFAHLIHQNPFERVDFERVQPLIHSSETVDFQEIRCEEKSYGPFRGFFSMRQNMVFAHEFHFKLGSGSSYGEMYLDTHPSHLQFGVLSRLTGLDLTEILPQKYLKNPSSGDQKLSGRSGMVVNLAHGSIDGRVDVTQIGASQLLTLINVMDPDYKDEQMNLARSGLSVGYPTFVQMHLQDGFMDMNVALGGALGSIPGNLSIRGIPISPWISGATAEAVKKTQEGPLK